MRAIAVLPVLLYHAHVPYFTGGYVGVDVFFVISGYLITAILYREMAVEQFTIFGFYERRVRRIIPALVAVMAAIFVISWFLFLPKDLDDTGQSFTATSTFVSNFLFYFKTTYFGTAAEDKPLLHTWSLAVEEQFYILFPIFLFIAMRFARKRVALVLALTAATSLAISTWSVYQFPVETFYFPFTRAWELLLGSILAVALQKGLIRESRSVALAAIGLGLIAASVILLNDRSRFPGASALPVCLGTVLVLYAGSGGSSGVVGRVLQSRFFVFTGLISYSLYLWHWPALVFTSYYVIRPLTGFESALVLSGAYFASVLSWRFVELPIRRGQILRSRRALFLAAFVALGAFSATGLTLILFDGFPERLPHHVVQLSRAAKAEPHAGCPRAAGATFGGMCKIGSGRPTFVVWGDSHADALQPAFRRAAQQNDASGLVLTANGCAPVIGLIPDKRGRQQNDCVAYNRQATRLIRDLRPAAVFLVANWLAYESPDTFENGTLPSALGATLRSLHGLNVYIVSRVPGGRIEVASALARRELFHRPVEIGYSRTEVARIHAPLDRLFRRMQSEHAVSVVSVENYLCTRDRCPVEANGEALYSDAHHLTPAGAAFLVHPLQKLPPHEVPPR